MTTGPAALTADDLPIRVPLIQDETLASFLIRTSTANGLPVEALLGTLTEAAPDIPEDGLTPQRDEVRLSAESLAHLAALVVREPEQLARAIPGVRPAGLVDAPRVEVWPRDLGAPPLPACPLCMEPGAWLAAEGHRWRPCGCGRRWMAGDDGGYTIDTGPVPDLGRALARHRALVHRVGPAADALVTDAHQVMLWWWWSGLVAEAWRVREDALGMARHRRRAAPVSVYPEAVALAELMWTWEERRARPGASAERWLDSAAKLSPAGTLTPRERAPLTYWLEQHRPVPAGKPAGRSVAERRWNRLPALHHRPRPEEHGPLRAPTCLMWVYGLPLTSTTDVCPRCNGRAPSCRWLPYSGCTGLPRK
ncbi:TniQ family protein [Streptomyces sp. H10-C2]|uniref:TniQ family protein n=1 Tax=unclassified Streptomyces TaxID=2593676 RepID=UPI0024BB0489|nr:MULTISPECIES: TniQ family protein [unclassified Streptomyces]MDJ0345516.1 TniQ family protein [Streptomyces sp. PH10-H1]MDJ0374462.1 TniQ family protein [Streptomyces sp. H10-C2]